MTAKSTAAYAIVTFQFLCVGVLLYSGPIFPIEALEIGLLAGGLALGVWAIMSMRLVNFNVTYVPKEASQHVVSGPYQLIRHPMYSALLIAAAGLVTNQITAFRVSVWIILLLILLVKMKKEEMLLTGHFESYAAYRTRTKKLIPWLY